MITLMKVPYMRGDRSSHPDRICPQI
jgi:hypothetical protein